MGAADASTREDELSQLDLSAVIIHYQTPELLKIAVESFKRFYPQTPLYVVDNGSDSEVVDRVEEWIGEQSNTQWPSAVCLPATAAPAVDPTVLH